MRGGAEFMQTSYRSLIVTAVLALVFGFAGAAVWSLTGLADARTKSYLLDNPQLLPEMAEAWQTKQSAERLAGISQDVLSAFDGAVLGNPGGSKEIGRASCRERVGQYV